MNNAREVRFCFSDLFSILLDPAPNHSKLNEIAPAVTGTILCNSLRLMVTLWSECFFSISIYAKKNYLLFYIGETQGKYTTVFYTPVFFVLSG
ncbi:MAG: hypothetical protein L6461_20020 [Anaerolineae bacterium]|nr:hypothetical protein [Anaerolineae bacterium]